MKGRPFEGGDWPVVEDEEIPRVEGRIGFAYRNAFVLSTAFSYDSEVLLWVAETDIWSANLHLYYRFRESYGDRRLVEDAPGHLFLPYEKADLLSYVQICLQCGWGFWILGLEGYARLFVSHDEWFVAIVRDDEDRKRLADA